MGYQTEAGPEAFKDGFRPVPLAEATKEIRAAAEDKQHWVIIGEPKHDKELAALSKIPGVIGHHHDGRHQERGDEDEEIVGRYSAGTADLMPKTSRSNAAGNKTTARWTLIIPRDQIQGGDLAELLDQKITSYATVLGRGNPEIFSDALPKDAA